jgi:acyl-homoserine lactone acylase PvdQ
LRRGLKSRPSPTCDRISDVTLTLEPPHPLGMITPEFRCVGAVIPRLPGFAIGRTSFIAVAATNNYSDMQDLYVETIDPNRPDHYLEGQVSHPLQQRKRWIRRILAPIL